MISSTENKIKSFKGDDRAADGIPVEVKLDNGGYFEAYLMDIINGEALIHFPCGWMPEGKYPFSQVRFPPAEQTPRSALQEKMIAEVLVNKDQGFYEGWFKCSIQMLKSEFCHFEYLDAQNGSDFGYTCNMRTPNINPKLSMDMLHVYKIIIPESIREYARYDNVHKTLKDAMDSALVNYDADRGEITIISRNIADISSVKFLEMMHLESLSLKSRYLQSRGKLNSTSEIPRISDFTAEFTVPRTYLGLAIGNGKVNLRAAQKIKGISAVQLIRESNKFVIQGNTEEAVKEARELLEIKIESYLVLEKHMSQLVGRESENIHKIIRATGAVEINVEDIQGALNRKEKGKDLSVYIIGSAQAIEKAKIFLQFQIEHICVVQSLREEKFDMNREIAMFVRTDRTPESVLSTYSSETVQSTRKTVSSTNLSNNLKEVEELQNLNELLFEDYEEAAELDIILENITPRNIDQEDNATHNNLESINKEDIDQEDLYLGNNTTKDVNLEDINKEDIKVKSVNEKDLDLGENTRRDINLENSNLQDTTSDINLQDIIAKDLGLGENTTDLKQDINLENTTSKDINQEDTTSDNLEDINEGHIDQENLDLGNNTSKGVNLEDINEGHIDQENLDLGNNTSKGVNLEDINKEDIKKEDIKKEDIKKEDIKKEDIKEEDINEKDINKEDINAKDLHLGENTTTDLEQDINLKNTTSKDINLEDATTHINKEDINGEDINLKDATTDINKDNLDLGYIKATDFNLEDTTTDINLEKKDFLAVENNTTTDINRENITTIDINQQDINEEDLDLGNNTTRLNVSIESNEDIYDVMRPKEVETVASVGSQSVEDPDFWIPDIDNTPSKTLLETQDTTCRNLIKEQVVEEIDQVTSQAETYTEEIYDVKKTQETYLQEENLHLEANCSTPKYYNGVENFIKKPIVTPRLSLLRKSKKFKNASTDTDDMLGYSSPSPSEEKSISSKSEMSSFCDSEISIKIGNTVYSGFLKDLHENSSQEERIESQCDDQESDYSLPVDDEPKDLNSTDGSEDISFKGQNSTILLNGDKDSI